MKIHKEVLVLFDAGAPVEFVTLAEVVNRRLKRSIAYPTTIVGETTRAIVQETYSGITECWRIVTFKIVVSVYFVQIQEFVLALSCYA